MSTKSYTNVFGTKNYIIGISGIIGVGKSTLTNDIGNKLNCEILKEPVETNEYLSKFYEDMSKYAFPMQVYLLNHRFKQHQQMVFGKTRRYGGRRRRRPRDLHRNRQRH
jgi:deoxyadenosine/deoxycytidine kinase